MACLPLVVFYLFAYVACIGDIGFWPASACFFAAPAMVGWIMLWIHP